MATQLSQVDALLRKHVGFGLRVALLILALLAMAGVAVGVLLPKFEATTLLQFPEPQKEKSAGDQKLFPEQRTTDPRANVIELAAYKRVAASYDSVVELSSYLTASGLSSRPAAERLLKQAEYPGFWGKAAVPVLPFSKRDQKEFGDIKDASATTMLGVELTADARTETVAQEMVNILAGYFINAVVRERVRAWALAGKVDSKSQEKSIRADILRAGLDIELFGRRADDMKVVLARYPDAARMDSRQLLSVSPTDSGERYLSPLAQLVGAESAISQRRESIRRWQRELKQKAVLAQFFMDADTLLAREVEVVRLLAELKTLATKTFSHAEATEEWNQEAALRVNGALDNFEVMRSQFGVFNGIRTGEVASRSPLRLASLGIAAGLALLGTLAFLRATLQGGRGEDEPAPEESDQT